ncbi:MAG: Na+/H+ antiporter NhaA [Verrucomicrobiales bacterium]|nr:Na+/H+ antiporter NhaA [Verrucomicrobiales bacterium]
MIKREQNLPPETPRLPAELIDWLRKPVARFIHFGVAAGGVLLLFTIVALIIANSPWSAGYLRFWETEIGINAGSFEVTRPLRGLINDGLMTLFFFVIALELKRELVVGEMRNLRVAALSVCAALGGMVMPALLYLTIQMGQPGQSGWGTVMATDTAFVIGCLALLGPRIPQSLRIFMLSLAIVDDVGAILVVAVGYGHDINWIALGLSVFGFIVVFGMRRLGIRHMAIYFAAGLFVWIATDLSGVHATVAGVVLGLMTPTRRWVSDERLHSILNQVVDNPSGNDWSGDTDDRKALRLAEAAARETLSPVERLEMALLPWVSFVVMPLFALANAGIPISITGMGNSVTVAVFMAFAFGKPMGVIGFSWLAVRIGLAVRPPELNWTLLAAGGLLAGIGFTMALFIANLAFGADLINDAKTGILAASVFSAVAGTCMLFLWSSRSKRAMPTAGGS